LPGRWQKFQQSKEQIMKKTINVVLATLLAGGASLALAQSATANSVANAQSFATDFRTLQQESMAMPMISPPVDRNAKPDDPIPKATTLAQKEAWFAEENQWLQRMSTAMPAGSPPVNKYERAADPLPKATTYPEKVAAFRSEERFLQENSTR
jgi:hypothetical protein